MKAVIVGGKLQGCEASYLAHKAGWEVYLVDRKTAVPAYGLCDYYSMLDIEEDREELLKVIKGKDFVVPAFEDEKLEVFERSKPNKQLNHKTKYPSANNP